MRCRLESERGEAIETVDDRSDLLQGLLPPIGDQSFQCLRFVDWYGETVFNRLQMETFLLELDLMQRKAERPAERELLGKIEGLARRCRDEVHLYLRFSGD